MYWIGCALYGFDLYTDLNNLIFLLDPHAVVFNLSQTCLRKVFRWVAKPSIYRYRCYSRKGDDNVCADVLIR